MVAAVWFVAAGALADARGDYLVRLLKDSKTFRVRAQAALSLGKLPQSRRHTQALIRALKDKHPAVRLAAVSSLEKIGDTTTKSALKKRLKDKDRSVRTAARRALKSIDELASAAGRQGPGKPKYYVAIGAPAAKARDVDSVVLSSLKTEIENQMLQREGVVLAAPGQAPASVRRLLKKRRLRGFHVETSVVSLRNSGSATRAKVSVIVSTYPGRDIRAMLSGKATAQGGDPSTRATQAIVGATSGALRRVATAMEQARPGL